MTRTASCFFALGIGIALAAACGDDDGGDGVGGAGGGGGSGGTGASGGAAGTGGDAGSSGGDAGTGGATAGAGGNTAGTAGTGAGSGGSSGSSAGTAGTAGTSSGGAAGSGEEPGDAGPDASGDAGPDASAAGSAGTAGTGPVGPPVDSGINGNCPSFPNAANLAVVGAQNGQQVVIARVIFDTTDGSATVVLRGVVSEVSGDPFYSSPKQLCGGPDDADCVDIDALNLGALTADQEVQVELPGVTPDGGEIALISNVPVVPEAFTFAYIAWGEDFISEIPDPGDADASNLPTSLDERADNDGFWDLGLRIAVDAQTNTIVGIGDTIDPVAGFTACTGDDL